MVHSCVIGCHNGTLSSVRPADLLAQALKALGVMRRLGLRPEITNVNGGAIVVGHPVGCSGARILTTLLHEVKRRAPGEDHPYYGLATLCVGVGMGVSTLVEGVGEE